MLVPFPRAIYLSSSFPLPRLSLSLVDISSSLAFLPLPPTASCLHFPLAFSLSRCFLRLIPPASPPLIADENVRPFLVKNEERERERTLLSASVDPRVCACVCVSPGVLLTASAAWLPACLACVSREAVFTSLSAHSIKFCEKMATCLIHPASLSVSVCFPACDVRPQYDPHDISPRKSEAGVRREASTRGR